jgi:putative tricarboxylic transport membrane protein
LSLKFVNKNILVGIIVAVAWLGFGLEAQQFTSSGFSDRLGAAYFPTLLAVCGFGLSLLVIWKAVRGSRTPDRQAEVEAASQQRPKYWRALAMICIPFAWPLVVSYVGFLIATPVLLVALLLLLGVRSPLQLGIVAFVLTAILWLVFNVLFGVEFPGPHWGG